MPDSAAELAVLVNGRFSVALEHSPSRTRGGAPLCAHSTARAHQPRAPPSVFEALQARAPGCGDQRRVGCGSGLVSRQEVQLALQGGRVEGADSPEVGVGCQRQTVLSTQFGPMCSYEGITSPAFRLSVFRCDLVIYARRMLWDSLGIEGNNVFPNIRRQFIRTQSEGVSGHDKHFRKLLAM